MARGTLFWVELPPSNGREQSGRRPVVALQSDLAGEPMMVFAPITSNLYTTRYAFTARVEPSP